VTTAVRFTLEELADTAPGNSVEVRVPPAGAVQAVAGRASVAQAVRHECHQTNHYLVNQRLRLDTGRENCCSSTG